MRDDDCLDLSIGNKDSKKWSRIHFEGRSDRMIRKRKSSFVPGLVHLIKWETLGEYSWGHRKSRLLFWVVT